LTSRPTDYRLARAHGVAVLGRLAVVAGLLVGLAVALGAVADPPPLVWVPVAVLLGLAGLLTVVAGVRVLRPPMLLHLDDQGFRLRVLRGAGPTSAAWAEVEGVRRERLTPGPSLVIALSRGRRTVVPLHLVDGGPQTVDRLDADLRTRLDRAHGQRRRG